MATNSATCLSVCRQGTPFTDLGCTSVNDLACLCMSTQNLYDQRLQTCLIQSCGGSIAVDSMIVWGNQCQNFLQTAPFSVLFPTTSTTPVLTLPTSNTSRLVSATIVPPRVSTSSTPSSTIPPPTSQAPPTSTSSSTTAQQTSTSSSSSAVSTSSQAAQDTSAAEAAASAQRTAVIGGVLGAIAILGVLAIVWAYLRRKQNIMKRSMEGEDRFSVYAGEMDSSATAAVRPWNTGATAPYPAPLVASRPYVDPAYSNESGVGFNMAQRPGLNQGWGYETGYSSHSGSTDNWQNEPYASAPMVPPKYDSFGTPPPVPEKASYSFTEKSAAAVRPPPTFVPMGYASTSSQQQQQQQPVPTAYMNSQVPMSHMNMNGSYPSMRPPPPGTQSQSHSRQNSASDQDLHAIGQFFLKP